jgi:hypothetical protein
MNYSGQIQTATQADTPRTLGLLEGTCNRIGSRANEVDGIATRLHEIADRIFGSEPSKIDNAKSAPTPSPPYAAGQIAESHAALERAVGYLGRVLQRFEQL